MSKVQPAAALLPPPLPNQPLLTLPSLTPRSLPGDAIAMFWAADGDLPASADYDPDLTGPALAAAMLREELARAGQPAAVMVTARSVLVYGPLPAGEPVRATRLDDGRLHAVIDPAQLTDEHGRGRA